MALKDNHKVRLIKMETDDALIDYEEYISLITSSLGEGQLLNKVIKILYKFTDVIILKQQLTRDFNISDGDIRY